MTAALPFYFRLLPETLNLATAATAAMWIVFGIGIVTVLCRIRGIRKRSGWDTKSSWPNWKSYLAIAVLWIAGMVALAVAHQRDDAHYLHYCDSLRHHSIQWYDDHARLRFVIGVAEQRSALMKAPFDSAEALGQHLKAGKPVPDALSLSLVKPLEDRRPFDFLTRYVWAALWIVGGISGMCLWRHFQSVRRAAQTEAGMPPTANYWVPCLLIILWLSMGHGFVRASQYEELRHPSPYQRFLKFIYRDINYQLSRDRLRLNFARDHADHLALSHGYRVISGSQRQRFLQSTANLPKADVGITASTRSDPECDHYASALSELLIEAGYYHGAQFDTTPAGTPPPAFAQPLLDSLQDAGLANGVSIDHDKKRSPYFRLLVDRKP